MWRAVLVIFALIHIFTVSQASELVPQNEEILIVNTTASFFVLTEPSTPTTIKSTEEETTTKKHQVTYDQRQEGQYNIQADLENFMIVVIPPNPTVGVNLLDLLNQSALKRSNLQKLGMKHQLPSKHIGTGNLDDKLLNYSHTIQKQQSFEAPSTQDSEYIEGKTPYSVDISNSENDFGRFSPDPQVDIFPPPYPVNLHLLKPFQLEGKTVISHQSPNDKLREYLKRFSDMRLAKSIGDHPIIEELHTNRVVLNGDGRSTGTNVYVSDVYSLPPLTDGKLDIFDSYKTRSVGIEGLDSNWELKLIGASEQCGPDRRRDSYGICQFAPDIK